MGQITIVHCGVKNKNGIMSRVLRRALSAYGGVQWIDGAAVSCHHFSVPAASFHLADDDRRS